MLKRNKFAGILAVTALVLASCGGYGDDGTQAADTQAADTNTAAAPASDDASPGDNEESTTNSGAIVSTSSTELGDILVGEDGLSLYGFTDDTDGEPTCTNGCADAWPAVTVDGDELPDGLDPEVFSIVEGVDGSNQLKAGKWPLYFFAGDAEAGQLNGQNSGGVWFVVAPDGSLIKGTDTASADSVEDSDQAAETAPDGADDDTSGGTAGY